MLDLKRTIRDILVNHWPRDPGTPVRHECTDEITALIEANYISKTKVLEAITKHNGYRTRIIKELGLEDSDA